jgi:hypothetical protein
MKKYYMYIPLSFDKEKNTRFVVEVDDVSDLHFSGRVVARNKKAHWFLGYEAKTWANPMRDLRDGNKISFLPISIDEAKEQFDEHCL